ncbi:MAG: type II toxin-antitoxin system RelE family toxin [Dehalococcoidia bacterium]
MSSRYEVVVLRPAEKEIRRLAPKFRRQILEKLVGLETNPRPQDVRRLHGVERGYRVDSGEYRILYEIDDAERRVVVRVVKHRKDVYRNL